MVSLGTLGGQQSSALAVQGDGQAVVGYSETPSGATHAFAWSEATGMVDLGTLGGPYSAAQDISADGSIIVGESTDSSGLILAFRWTNAGMTSLGALPGYNRSTASAISADGSTIVGHCTSVGNNGPPGPTPYIWTAATGMQALPGGDGTVWDVNADGTLVVGELGFRAARWYSGTYELLDTSNSSFSVALSVSGIGGRIAGEVDYQATLWGPPTPPRALGSLVEGAESGAMGVNNDGTIVVGYSAPGAGQLPLAVLWRGTTGIRELGSLGGSYSNAIDVSSDGSVVVGVATTDFTNSMFRAFIWRDDDRDQDGIRDSWERSGVPYVDAAGNPRLLLDVDGDGTSDASPFRKDLFVEVDAMSGRAPSVSTLNRVRDAFDPSPRVVVPPVPGLAGGLPNVGLHIQTAPDDLHLSLLRDGNYTQGTQGWEADFAIDKARYFGTPVERASPDWPQIYEIKRRVFRYCIFANTMGDINDSTSGCSEGEPCDDFIITLGHRDYLDDLDLEVKKGATFMHELGHTLGLGHGGCDRINHKPNYYSIMNYLWQFPEAWQGGIWDLRYSESELPTLDESALRERDGIGIGPSVPVPFLHVGSTPCTYSRTVAGLGTVNFGRLDPAPPFSPVDWNGDCNPSGTPGVVAADINNVDTSGEGLQELRGHHDWANLIYSFVDTPTFGPGAAGIDIGCRFDLAASSIIASIPGPIGESICTAAPNSAQRRAVMSASGSARIADSRFIVIATGMPSQAFGFFLASRAQGLVPGSGGSQGTLCLDGPIGRGVGGSIFNSGAFGVASLTADLERMPLAGGFVAVQPGETWYMQAWYRDANPGPTSNFTDAIRVTFE